MWVKAMALTDINPTQAPYGPEGVSELACILRR